MLEVDTPDPLDAHPAHAGINEVIGRLQIRGDYSRVQIGHEEADKMIGALRFYRDEHEKLRVGNLDYAAQVSQMLANRGTSPAQDAAATARLMEIVCTGMRDQAVQTVRVVLEELPQILRQVPAGPREKSAADYARELRERHATEFSHSDHGIGG